VVASPPMSHKGLVTALACALIIPAWGAPTTSEAKPTARATHTRAVPKRSAKKSARAKAEKPEKTHRSDPAARAPSPANVTQSLTPVRALATPVQPSSLQPTKAPVRKRYAAPLVEHPLEPSEKALTNSLQLNILQSGPSGSWTIQVSNVGPAAVLTATDSRLLWFEVKVPGRRDPVACRLPSAMLPKRLGAASPRMLDPGESFSLRIDPRMYCFENGEQHTLVPGAFVQPYYGWPEKTGTAWANGKRQAVRLGQVAPYVAHALAESASEYAREEAEEEDSDADDLQSDEDEIDDEESSELDDPEADEAEVDDDDADAEEAATAGARGESAIAKASTPAAAPHAAQTPGSEAVPAAKAVATEDTSKNPGDNREAIADAPFGETTLEGVPESVPTPGPAPATAAREEPHHHRPANLRDLQLMEPGLKRIAGEGFALDSTYVGWSRTRYQGSTDAGAPASVGPLELSVSYGADAPSPRDVVVTVSLANVSDETVRAYFRREVVTFSIIGPDGEQRCEADSAFEGTDTTGSVSLAPKARQSLTTRLMEFCPDEVFARPGFYYVSARMAAVFGENFESDGVGRVRDLVTASPRPVRVHTAELPFRARRRPSFSSAPPQQPAATPVPTPPPDVQQVQQPVQPVPAPAPAAPAPPPITPGE
jgi:hypothetical protein